MDETIRTAAISPLRQRLIDDMNCAGSRERRSATTSAMSDASRHSLGVRRIRRRPTTCAGSRSSSGRTACRADHEQHRVGAAVLLHPDGRPPGPSAQARPAAHPRNLPVVLSRDEVARLLNATTCLKHQAALSVAYGAGLRVAEVSTLKVTDVDSERMLLRVERGKGGRYRNAMLSEDLLTLLRQWWKAGRQQGVMHRKAGCSRDSTR